MPDAAPTMPILFLDDVLLAVDKPSGLVVHRGWARDRLTVLDLARAVAGVPVHPLHRLDRGTSGVLLFALDKRWLAPMQAQWHSDAVTKRYLALVRGITPESATIDHPVPKSPKGARVPAVTEIRRLATFERYSLVEARPRTGRLHQIRRHLKHLSHPLIGDVRYGKGEHNRLFRERFGLHRLVLHAASLAVVHPVTGARLCLRAPLPTDLAGPFAAMGLLDGVAAAGEPSQHVGVDA